MEDTTPSGRDSVEEIGAALLCGLETKIRRMLTQTLKFFCTFMALEGLCEIYDVAVQFVLYNLVYFLVLC